MQIDWLKEVTIRNNISFKMKLVEAPLFRILQSDDELRRQLFLIEEAGRTSYQSFRGEIDEVSAAKFAGMIRDRNHLSVLEHSMMTVALYGISRGATHELVRHRLASPTQESTRYVDYVKGEDSPDLARFQMEAVLPPHKDANLRVDLGDGRMMSPAEMMAEEEKFYRALRRADWLPEDARQVLPTGLVSDIVVTANFREWRHIFELRTQKAAHWEIRRVMNGLLDKCMDVLPAIFGDFEKAGVDKNGLAFYEIKKRNG